MGGARMIDYQKAAELLNAYHAEMARDIDALSMVHQPNLRAALVDIQLKGGVFREMLWLMIAQGDGLK
jgi:hypothetical protein